MKLDAIGLKHGTDKASSHHGYLDVYERVFAWMFDKPLKILEVGVFRGASAATWLEAFPKATVIGIDSVTKQCKVQDSRLHLLKGDAADPNIYEVALQRHGPFDIVIEDSAHQEPTSLACFKAFPRLVSPGGVMIFEDMHVAYNHRKHSTLVSFLAEVVKQAQGGGAIRLYAKTDAHMATDLAKAIDRIEMHTGLVIVWRKS